MLWLKVAIPVLMVAAGGGAMAVAATGSDASPAGAAQVWIDAPTGVAPFAPGKVAVSAHATADDSISGLVLYVDGDEVDADDDLVRNDLLVFGEFSWDAAAGVHELVVKQVGGEGNSSDVLVVTVVDGAPVAPEPTTTTTTEPGATTSSTQPGETTTTTEPEETTTTVDAGTTVPSEIDDTVPATPVPTTRPPTTTTTRPPQPAPVIDAASFSGNPLVYTNVGCPYSVTVSARIRNATSATVTVSGASIFIDMDQSGSTWTAVIASGVPQSAVGVWSVKVTAANATGTVERTVGNLTIRPGCAKD